MGDFDHKELIHTYNKNGFTVNIYRTVMTEKERMLKNIQIKYEIINIIKDFICFEKRIKK